jgi:WD40 repeat protein
VTPNCIGFRNRDTKTFAMLGSDEGKVYKANIFQHDTGIVETIDAHAAPVTQLSFHPAFKGDAAELADLYLTSSYDWSCKLWSVRTNTCVRGAARASTTRAPPAPPPPARRPQAAADVPERAGLRAGCEVVADPPGAVCVWRQ